MLHLSYVRCAERTHAAPRQRASRPTRLMLRHTAVIASDDGSELIRPQAASQNTGKCHHATAAAERMLHSTPAAWQTSQRGAVPAACAKQCCTRDSSTCGQRGALASTRWCAAQRARLRHQRVQPQRRRDQVAHARVARRRRRRQRGDVLLPVPPRRQEVWADNHGAGAVRNARVERVGDGGWRLRACAASAAPQRLAAPPACSHQLHVRRVHHRPPCVRFVRVHEAQLRSSGVA